MLSRLTALVGGGSTLPFELGEEFPSSSSFCGWKHWRGTSRADGSPVSIFRVAAASKSVQRLEAARNAARRLRMLRHPNVLTFREVVELEERGEAVLYLVTEAVTPLAIVLRDMDTSTREQYLSMGLCAVVGALSFLANDCALVHGAVCLAAVAVTETLDWKLHGLDVASDHQFASQYDLPLTASSWLVPQQYKPGEVAKGDWQAVKEGPAWAVDAWGLGCLMQEVYSGNSLTRTEDLRNTEHIPKQLLQYYQRLLASQPVRRLNPRQLLDSGVLRNRLAEATSFLDNLAIKDAIERDTFFKKLPSLLPSIPSLVAQRKLLPMLANAIEFGGAPPIALTTLLEIGKTLPEETYAKQVVPIITKLFASSDRGIRRGLLENIATFGPALQDKVVEEQIYGQVASGFADGNPYLRELTLKSMAVLGPKLSQKTLNQSLLKHLAKLQVDEEASIRANTTVLLGNLASYMSEATCKKVLLNAFTRALRDGFPPARVAGLKAIAATAQFHSPEDAAARVVPAVGPLCIDAVHEVRASALACLEHFIKVLADYHLELERKAAVLQDSDAAATEPAPAPGSSSGGSLLNSFGWATAVSNLGLGRGGTADVGGNQPVVTAPTGPPPPADVARAIDVGSVSKQLDPPAPQAPASQCTARHDGTMFKDMADDAEVEREARQRLSKHSLRSSRSAAGKPSAAAGQQSSGAVLAATSGNDGWTGGDGWDTDAGAATAPSRPMTTRPGAVSGAMSPRRTPGARTANTGIMRKAAGSSSSAPRKSAGGGGMKLGASRLGASLKEDDSFGNW